MFICCDFYLNQVRAKQHASCCDGCNRWQHRLCETKISRSLYMATMRGEGIVTWHCRDCTAPSFVGDHSSISIPEMESTRLEVKKFEIIRKLIELIKLVGLLKKKLIISNQAPIVQTATLEWTDDETIRDDEATEKENEESVRLEVKIGDISFYSFHYAPMTNKAYGPHV